MIEKLRNFSNRQVTFTLGSLFRIIIGTILVTLIFLFATNNSFANVSEWVYFIGLIALSIVTLIPVIKEQNWWNSPRTEPSVLELVIWAIIGFSLVFTSSSIDNYDTQLITKIIGISIGGIVLFQTVMKILWLSRQNNNYEP